MTPSIIFDFDGTLAVGHGPVLAYARLVAPAAAPGYLDRVAQALADHDGGASPYRDGYDVVGSLARADGVDALATEAAYQGSREQLGTDLAPVTTVPDLPALLTDLRRHARLVLATNAPAEGVERVLEGWGVRHLFDAVHVTVGKPAGLTPIVADALALGPVLAVGDIVELDLAPALELGADTALVGATAASPSTASVPVTLRGPSLAALASDLKTWAATAASSTPAPTGAVVSTER